MLEHLVIFVEAILIGVAAGAFYVSREWGKLSEEWGKISKEWVALSNARKEQP